MILLTNAYMCVCEFFGSHFFSPHKCGSQKSYQKIHFLFRHEYETPPLTNFKDWPEEFVMDNSPQTIDDTELTINSFSHPVSISTRAILVLYTYLQCPYNFIILNFFRSPILIVTPRAIWFIVTTTQKWSKKLLKNHFRSNPCKSQFFLFLSFFPLHCAPLF